MNAARIVSALGPIDVRRVRRDGLLGWMIAIPVGTALIMRFGVPPLTAWLAGTYDFDLTPYYPLIGGYFIVVMVPIVLGFVIGFLLLDERDDATLQALQVTPLSPVGYLTYRTATPTLLSLLLMFLLVPLAGLTTLGPLATVVVALASAPLAPLIAFLLPAFAQNKVQGFALVKLAGAVLMLPVLAFFVPGPWRWLAGIVPSFWSMETLWSLSEGRQPWPPLAVALGYPALLVVLLGRRFARGLVA